jgi:tRNA(adenine34) deaminase
MQNTQTPLQYEQDEAFMRLALKQAETAEASGEVPVGAILVHGQQVIAEAHNQPITLSDPTAHAEIMVLRQAAQVFNNYRLPGTTVYVTLEPCAMCTAALIHARVARLVYATAEPRAGACGSVFDLAVHPALNHQLEVCAGVLGELAQAQLKNFFRAKRS